MSQRKSYGGFPLLMCEVSEGVQTSSPATVSEPTQQPSAGQPVTMYLPRNVSFLPPSPVDAWMPHYLDFLHRGVPLIKKKKKAISSSGFCLRQFNQWK